MYIGDILNLTKAGAMTEVVEEHWPPPSAAAARG
jgi:hypothetical protein